MLMEVQDWYIAGRRTRNPFSSDADLVERFNNWLTEHDREVVARTLAAQSTGGVCQIKDPDLEWEGWIEEATVLLTGTIWEYGFYDSEHPETIFWYSFGVSFDSAAQAKRVGDKSVYGKTVIVRRKHGATEWEHAEGEEQ